MSVNRSNSRIHARSQVGRRFSSLSFSKHRDLSSKFNWYIYTDIYTYIFFVKNPFWALCFLRCIYFLLFDICLTEQRKKIYRVDKTTRKSIVIMFSRIRLSDEKIAAKEKWPTRVNCSRKRRILVSVSVGSESSECFLVLCTKLRSLRVIYVRLRVHD